MTTSYTTTSTFSRTHAAYLASKIAADLRQLQLFYGRPTDTNITKYIDEVVILLLDGYLGSVSYGFKRGDNWVIALKYDARDGSIVKDERAGRVTPGVNVTGADWYSFLTYSPKYGALTQKERDAVEAKLPFRRSAGEEPRVGGSWSSDRSYSSGGVGLQRSTFTSS